MALGSSTSRLDAEVSGRASEAMEAAVSRRLDVVQTELNNMVHRERATKDSMFATIFQALAHMQNEQTDTENLLRAMAERVETQRPVQNYEITAAEGAQWNRDVRAQLNAIEERVQHQSTMQSLWTTAAESFKEKVQESADQRRTLVQERILSVSEAVLRQMPEDCIEHQRQPSGQEHGVTTHVSQQQPHNVISQKADACGQQPIARSGGQSSQEEQAHETTPGQGSRWQPGHDLLQSAAVGGQQRSSTQPIAGRGRHCSARVQEHNVTFSQGAQQKPCNVPSQPLGVGGQQRTKQPVESNGGHCSSGAQARQRILGQGPLPQPGFGLTQPVVACRHQPSTQPIAKGGRQRHPSAAEQRVVFIRGLPAHVVQQHCTSGQPQHVTTSCIWRRAVAAGHARAHRDIDHMVTAIGQVTHVAPRRQEMRHVSSGGPHLRSTHPNLAPQIVSSTMHSLQIIDGQYVLPVMRGASSAVRWPRQPSYVHAGCHLGHMVAGRLVTGRHAL